MLEPPQKPITIPTIRLPFHPPALPPCSAPSLIYLITPLFLLITIQKIPGHVPTSPITLKIRLIKQFQIHNLNALKCLITKIEEYSTNEIK